jgi:hypothetical protein
MEILRQTKRIDIKRNHLELDLKPQKRLLRVVGSHLFQNMKRYFEMKFNVKAISIQPFKITLRKELKRMFLEMDDKSLDLHLEHFELIIDGCNYQDIFNRKESLCLFFLTFETPEVLDKSKTDLKVELKFDQENVGKFILELEIFQLDLIEM